MSQQSRPPTRESRRIRGLGPTNPLSPPSPSSSISSVNLQSTIFPGINSTSTNHHNLPNLSIHDSTVNPSIPQSHSSFNHYYSTSSTQPSPSLNPPFHRNTPFTPPHVSDASSSQYNSVLHAPNPLNPYNTANFINTPFQPTPIRPLPTSSQNSTISSNTQSHHPPSQPPSQFITVPSHSPSSPPSIHNTTPPNNHFSHTTPMYDPFNHPVYQELRATNRNLNNALTLLQNEYTNLQRRHRGLQKSQFTQWSPQHSPLPTNYPHDATSVPYHSTHDTHSTHTPTDNHSTHSNSSPPSSPIPHHITPPHNSPTLKPTPIGGEALG